MPRPGIELSIAELHLLEGPFKDTLPTELHGLGIDDDIVKSTAINMIDLKVAQGK